MQSTRVDEACDDDMLEQFSSNSDISHTAGKLTDPSLLLLKHASDHERCSENYTNKDLSNNQQPDQKHNEKPKVILQFCRIEIESECHFATNYHQKPPIPPIIIPAPRPKPPPNNIGPPNIPPYPIPP